MKEREDTHMKKWEEACKHLRSMYDAFFNQTFNSEFGAFVTNPSFRMLKNRTLCHTIEIVQDILHHANYANKGYL